jgi:molybdopterin molybdotransferase
MIGFDEAMDLVRSVASPLGIVRVMLPEAVGRVLAEPVIAQIDSPRFDVSAMDGYAVRDEDLERLPASLHVAGESFPGHRWSEPLARGTTVRIFTGAALPAGADRVIIQEDVRRDGGVAIFDRRPLGASFIRPQGSDFRSGEELLAAGSVLGPRAIVAAAAADLAELQVYRRPRLQILSTGDELAEPGSARAQPDAIPESVSIGIAASAQQWGAECVGRSRVPDELASMRSAAEAALEKADVVAVTGGASVGEKDLAKAVLEPLGLELLFSKVAIKPGKPVWLGRAAGKLVIGLPGNPTSALVTARLFLAPLLAGLTGQPVERALCWRAMPLSTPLEACGGRETFHRARADKANAEILGSQDSSAQKALAEADLLVRQRANAPAIAAGERVDVLDF